MNSVLIVEDEEAICWGIERVAQGMGWSTCKANSAEQAMRLSLPVKPTAIILDVRLPGIDGLAAMRLFRERWGNLPIVIMTAFGDLETAVTAVRNGAYEYIVKPFDTETIRRVLLRTAEHVGEMSAPSPNLPTGKPSITPAVAGFVAQTPVMQEVFSRIALAADSDVAVLLTGESGTGKELAAHAIHRFSRRAAKQLVVVNVAALSPTLAESELFGHVRGAFTGADQNRSGLLSQAHGGTLFLDEVAEIPLPIQVKLLRVLEQKEVTPVGSNSPVPCDFRLVTATHQNLARMVSDGDFRQDLYYRLAAFQINLPPLRERLDDIVPLANYFLEKSQNGTRRPMLSPAAEKKLLSLSWSGNVRELRNAMEHAAIASRGQSILPEHLPDPSSVTLNHLGDGLVARIQELLCQWVQETIRRGDGDEQLYNQLLQLVEPPVFKELLKAHHGQVSNSARVLGLHRTTVRRKIDQYQLEDPH